MIVRRAIFADIPAIRVGFAHLVAELEAQRLVPYPMHDAGTLDDFTVHLAGRVGVDPRLLLYVALEEESHALLGFLGGEVSERVLGYPTRFGAAHWLYVAPHARKLGVGRALVRFACGDLAELGITHVELAALTHDDQWLKRGWLPYLVHYVLPLEGVMAGAAERPPAPALEPAPALAVPEPLPGPEPAPLAAANGNGAAPRLRRVPKLPRLRPLGRKEFFLPRDQITERTSIDHLPLSARAYNVCTNGGYETLGDLSALTRRDLLRTKNCGRVVIGEIQRLLESVGRALAKEQPCA